MPRTLHEALVDRLEQEAAEFSGMIDELLAERESIPPDQRTGPGWKTYDERFVELILLKQAVVKLHRLLAVEHHRNLPTLGGDLEGVPLAAGLGSDPKSRAWGV